MYVRDREHSLSCDLCSENALPGFVPIHLNDRSCCSGWNSPPPPSSFDTMYGSLKDEEEMARASWRLKAVGKLSASDICLQEAQGKSKDLQLCKW